MHLVDSHCHLYSSKFAQDHEAMIARAVENDVREFYLPNIDQTSIADMLALEAKYPDRCFSMMGLHPVSVKANFEEELAIVKSWLDRRSFVAVGEIGLDLYWDKTFFEQQKSAFRTQIGWAKALGLPIVIHSRNSTAEVLEILRELHDDRLRGIFHCFGGSVSEAKAITELGFYLGIGGVLTYKNSGLGDTLREIDLEHLVLETDAPYLAPVPHRGKRNESAYVRIVAQHLSNLKEMPLEHIAEVTTRNVQKIFAKRETSLYLRP